jgi:hypothetical protein
VLANVATFDAIRDRWNVGEMAAAHLALDVREDLDVLTYGGDS